MAIMDEHDSLQKTNVFTRVHASNYNQQQLKDVIQTKWVIRSRPGLWSRRHKEKAESTIRSKRIYAE
eukprot:268356-Amphidinium_carterae.1